MLEHAVKMSIMGALNLSEGKYSEIKLETDLAADFGIDSLDAAEIIMRVEEDHDLEEIPEDYARKANTVKHIYDYVVEHCKKPLHKLVDLTKRDACLVQFLHGVGDAFGLSADEVEGISDMATLEEKIGATPGK